MNKTKLYYDAMNILNLKTSSSRCHKISFRSLEKYLPNMEIQISIKKSNKAEINQKSSKIK